MKRRGLFFPTITFFCCSKLWIRYTSTSGGSVDRGHRGHHGLVVVEELQGRPGRGGGSIIEPKRQELHRIIESWD